MIETLLKKIFSKGVETLWENKDLLILYLKTIVGKYRNKEIRFSISYLFRITIPNTDKYLLVNSTRIPNQLQPVGGAYKRYGDDKLFEDWGFQKDNNNNGVGVDAKSDKDLRFRVKGKNVIKVIKWFDEAKEREVSANREFIEELLSTKILSPKAFKSIEYKLVKRFSKHLEYSKYHKCYEVLIYDVFELIPNEKQKKELKNLAKTPNDINKGYAIVSIEDIDRLRYFENNVQVAKIGEHTKLLINKIF